MSENIPYGTQNPEPPAEPLTREEQYLSAIAGITSSSDIPEKPLTRVEKYLKKIVENGGGGGGGGFTPTQEQLDAMNSGITAEKLQNDETNILNIQTVTGHFVTDSASKMYYCTPTTPVNPQDGDIWIY